MQTRREFLRLGLASGIVALGTAGGSPILRQALAASGSKGDGRILVVLELAGGNDGLNTVIPYKDPLYARLRPKLGIPKREVLTLDGATGLHPRLRGLADLHASGRLAVVQGVGYPNPNRSHFRSTDIWHSGVCEREDTSTGWIGRFAEQNPGGGLRALGIDLRERPVALTARDAELPVLAGDGFTLYGGESKPEAQRDRLGRLAELRQGAGRPALAQALQGSARVAYRSAAQLEAAAGRTSAATYPATDLAKQLRLVADMASADLGMRIAFLRLRGFDTHAAQEGIHGDLLAQFSGAVSAFFQDLEGRGLAQKVLVLAYSEFGRRAAENASGGTDHGAAGPVLAVSGGLRGGLYGEAPDLEDLDEGDVRHKVDFRRVYATVLERWLDVPSETVLAGRYSPVGFL